MSRYRGLAFVLVSVALLFGAMQPVLAQETAERAGLRPDAPEFGKRGPYPVGYRVITIGEGSDHPLEADEWYPALNPDGKAESIAYEFTPKNPDWIAAETGVVLGHALADAPVDAAMAPYPLVVFSHGFSLNPATYSTIPEHYASYGFIVIAPEHIERN